jgi:glycosyltransferase involved in cell wall biosynthesis
MSRVSVVIPTYNRAGCIGRALESVLAQSHADLEVIVVDDGSTDDTARIVGEYADADRRVRWVACNRRTGAQAARNAGVRAAQGDWIAFLDSDDEWLPDSLRLRLGLAMERGLHVVHSDCYVSDPGSAELRRWELPAFEGRAYGPLLQRSGTTFPSLLISRDAVSRIGGLDETIQSFQEWDTAIRLAKHYEFGFVAEPTFVYHRGVADSLSHDARREATGYEQVLTKHRWAILTHCGPRAVASHYRTAASLYRKADDELAARRCLTMAAVFSPFSVVRRVRRLFGHATR